MVFASFSFRTVVFGWVLALTLGVLAVRAQEAPELDDKELEAVMREGTLDEEASTNLILDNSRTVVGRNFYDTFYRLYNDQAFVAAPDDDIDNSLDSAAATPRPRLALEDQTEFVITVDETPTPSVGNAIISISVNDQILWQNFIQARGDVIEAYATNAVAVIRQYVLNFKEIQKTLDSQDQSGSGIF